MRKLVFCVVISTFVFCSSSMAKEYVVGVENLDYLPYYSGVNNEYSGFAKDLLDVFAAKKGITFKYKVIPVRRLFKALLDQSVDFKFPDNPYWQGDMKKGKNVIYSDAVSKTIDGVMVIPGRKGAGVKKLKTIGTVMGFTPWEYKGDIDKGVIKLSENSNFEGLLNQVIKKRIDGAYINPVVAGYQLEKMSKKGQLVFDDSLPYAKNEYLLSTIKEKEILDAFNLFLKENKAQVDKLKAKYNITEAF